MGREPNIRPRRGLCRVDADWKCAIAAGSSTGIVDDARLDTRPQTYPTSLSSNCHANVQTEQRGPKDMCLTLDIFREARRSSLNDIEKLFVC